MSSWEDYALNQIKEAGLPIPIRQYKFLKDRKFTYDFCWPQFKLAFEVDGGVFQRGGHSTGKGITKDHEKFSLATIEGWRVIRATTGQVGQGLAIEWLKRFFENMKQRFYSKVEKTDTCWIWQGAKYTNGYGVLQVHKHLFDCYTTGAHRISYYLHGANFDLDKDVVCHSCDNRACVNPEHLRADTQSSNIQEMTDKGNNKGAFKVGHKGNLGAKNGSAKVSVELSKEICERYAQGGLSQRKLAEAYGISAPVISLILNGKHWTNKFVEKKDV